MQRFINFFLIIAAINLITSSYADNCQAVAKKFYLKKNYRPSMHELRERLGVADSTNRIRQMQYKWGDFYLISRDDKIVQKYGDIPAKLDIPEYKYKSLNIRKVMDELGRPDKTDKANLEELTWICKQTKSKIMVIIDKDDNIESYKGEFCSKPNAPLCSKFTYEGLILLMD